MIKKFVQSRILDVNSEIEFQISGKEVVGIVKEVNFHKDEYQTRLWYEVLYNDERYLVDGELYQVIK
jgi:hypothetical protein